jgi:hypothetical protein
MLQGRDSVHALKILGSGAKPRLLRNREDIRHNPARRDFPRKQARSNLQKKYDPVGQKLR